MQKYIPFKSFRIFPQTMTTSQKVIVISVTAGVALLGVLARYLRRRKTPRLPRRPRKYGYSNSLAAAGSGRRTRNSLRSPNDLASLAGSKASARSQSPGGSIVTASDRLSLASGSVGGGGGGGGALLIDGNGSIVIGNGLGQQTALLTPQQLGVMGMESLENVINFWEDALNAYHLPSTLSNALSLDTESEFCQEIQTLLDSAYLLQDQSELLFLDERSVLFRGGDDENYDDRENNFNNNLSSSNNRLTNENRSESDPNFDSAESFASALDQVADLREFEDLLESFTDVEQNYPLYRNAIKHYEEHQIPYRMMRTELVNCSSDSEYLAKLHCIRLAFQYLFKDMSIGRWVADTGRQILTDLLLLSDKDPKDFLIGYEHMMNFLQDQSNWPAIQKELEQRNVKAMTFYDVVLDFIILDAFKDLDSPPGSVKAVCQNRFLSNGFKETALTTAVWSVLKTKRRLLKYPNGFMAHFYIISEQISPLMAWGFFGPDENLREVCQYFREQTLGFLQDIFNFQKCRYTTVEDLSSDIHREMKNRVDNIGVKFSQ